MRRKTTVVLLGSLLVASCSDSSSESDTSDLGASPDAGQGDAAPDAAPDAEPDAVPDDRAVISHSFGTLTLEPFEERQPCISWTLDNDAPLYVERVSLGNDGAFHHSNWFVVPEDMYEGEDGFWDCSSRGFQELLSAVAGTVLFAQSTQSRYEEQFLGEGVVIKIPPRHAIVAGGHLLNLADTQVESELRMGLDVIHPRDVDVVVTPMRFTFYDLNLHPHTDTRFQVECDLRDVYGDPPDARLYWVLPHYHYLGNYFQVAAVGGELDGEVLFEHEGFNAEGNGDAFAPPIDLAGAERLRMTCGFYNPRDELVGWGIGDQEMCVGLFFLDAGQMADGVVESRELLSEEDDMVVYGGDCELIAVPKNPVQTPPTEAEIAGELVVPPSDDPGDGVPVRETCEDTPSEATAEAPATLTSLRDTIFTPSCAFSSCHGGGNPAYGLDLAAADLHAELLGHDVQSATDLPLVEPGDPDGSWLYHRLSRCEPQESDGTAVAHMPRNAPTLLAPRLVAKVRDWIANGALDD